MIKLGQDLPEVVVSTSYGTPALKLRGKLLTRLRPEDDSLVLLDVPADERSMLIEADASVFHTTPHYDGYPAVLVYLATVDAATLKHFLRRRWLNIAPKSLAKKALLF